MSSKTKIVVLHTKEVVYTGIFLLLAVILGVLLFFMFGPGKSMTASSSKAEAYIPGVYRSSIRLSDNTFDVEVTVDADRIQSIELVNLSEAAAAMFPENRIDILVNSAGILNHSDFLDMSEWKDDNVMDINAKGTFFMSQAIAKFMIESQIKGHILR